MKRRIAVLVVLFIVLFTFAVTLFVKKDDADKPVTTKKKTYVALGDSVSAGVGLFTNSDSSACDRTDESYPVVLAKKLDYTVTNISCSGATIPAGITGQQNVNNLTIASQVEQLFEKSPAPDYLTMTIGANDVGWVSALANCYAATCGTAAETEKIETAIQTVGDNLSTALRQINDHYSDGKPLMIVTGYYAVLSPTATCSDTIGIDPQETAWLNAQLIKLTIRLKESVSNFSFAQFMPIDFAGHELCTSSTWLQGLQDRKPFHPNEEGQKAIASQLENVITTQ